MCVLEATTDAAAARPGLLSLNRGVGVSRVGGGWDGWWWWWANSYTTIVAFSSSFSAPTPTSSMEAPPPQVPLLREESGCRRSLAFIGSSLACKHTNVDSNQEEEEGEKNFRRRPRSASRPRLLRRRRRLRRKRRKKQLRRGVLVVLEASPSPSSLPAPLLEVVVPKQTPSLSYSMAPCHFVTRQTIAGWSLGK